MKYIYTVVFEPIESGEGYQASVPDLPGCISSGKTLNEALFNIHDAASLWLVCAEDEDAVINAPSSQSEIIHSEKSMLSLIEIDTIEYRTATDNRSVRKNVSLPAWMARMADKQNLNCSQILQAALKKIFSEN